MALRTRFRPFKPFQPPLPPTGSFDPALGAARRAATRGLGDVRQDTALAATRAGQDLQFGTDQINTDFNRAQQDYQTNTQTLQRQFDILAGQQESQAAGAGVLGGGALMQAAAKRTANQQLAQAQLDLALRRAREGHDVGLGQLGVQAQRGQTDRDTALLRAGREDTAFGLDTRAQMAFQASQAGWEPPQPGEPGGMPAGRFVNQRGVQRQRIVRDGVEYIVAPDGTVVHHRRVGRR